MTKENLRKTGERARAMDAVESLMSRRWTEKQKGVLSGYIRDYLEKYSREKDADILDEGRLVKVLEDLRCVTLEGEKAVSMEELIQILSIFRAWGFEALSGAACSVESRFASLEERQALSGAYQRRFNEVIGSPEALRDELNLISKSQRELRDDLAALRREVQAAKGGESSLLIRELLQLAASRRSVRRIPRRRPR